LRLPKLIERHVPRFAPEALAERMGIPEGDFFVDGWEVRYVFWTVDQEEPSRLIPTQTLCLHQCCL
jgi:hypothetical protein